jgi:serine/threonine protein kinase
MPDVAPFRAWSNVEFRDGQGKWQEVDLLLLGRRRLHLIELKYYSGTLRGDDLTWLREGHRPEDSALKLARRKAQRLASRLRDELLRWAREGGRGFIDPRDHLPFVQEAVYLHHPEFRCLLPPGSRVDLFCPDGSERPAGLPGISERILEPGLPNRSVSPEIERTVVTLLGRIGLVQRRQHEVGSWVLDDEPLADGDGYQDWPACHRVVMTDRARIRFFITPPGSAAEVVTRSRRVVQHEYRLTARLAHDSLLRPRDLVEDELGVGLVFTADERFQRLDLWLAQHPDGIPMEMQLSLLRQIAEGVAYAHRHQVVHRGLCPAAVQVRELDDGSVRVLIGDWQAAGTVGGVRLTGLATSQSGENTEAARRAAAEDGPDRGTDTGRALVEAFEAPEGVWSADADRVRLDVFALGALAYYVVAGRPAAPDRATLRSRLQNDGGLDLAADLPQVQSALRTLVLEATRPTVTGRLSDVGRFLELLAVAEAAVQVPVEVVDPLDAVAGVVLDGRFRLERRLGKGSTAVGLLVADLQAEAGGEVRRVLKVALNEAAGGRLGDEAAVLRVLQHPRLVTLVEELEVGGRACLLLSNAGDETLADALRARPRLSLDLLERWGIDLLEAMVALDKAGINHRDIKPANLGVLEGRGDRTKHLVLLDFSLARAAADSVTAGTPPYLDPFLEAPGRGRYDSSAERYAVAVVLFEMATGRPPVFGDGLSHPLLTTEEATVEPAQFDSSVAAQLGPFFRQALARDAAARHDTATEMLATWRAVFTRVSRPGEDADARRARAVAASPQTRLAEAGLSARAISALEPLAVETAGDLAALDPGRLTVIKGVADATRREIRDRARLWRDRFTTVDAARSVGIDAAENVLDAPLTAMALAAQADRSQRRAARLLLGLDQGLPPFATPGQLAAALGTPRSRAARLIASLRDAWLNDDACRAELSRVSAAALDALERLGGVAAVSELVDAVAATLPMGRDVAADAQARRALASLVGVALGQRQGGGSGTLEFRRGRDGQMAMLATESALLDAADSAAQRAEELVAPTPHDLVVPEARAAELLRGDGTAMQRIDDARLVRLAAALSRTAAVSGRGELHSRELSPQAAVRLALAGLGAQPVTAQEVRGRVRARFPVLAQLPDRPRLDALLLEAGLALEYDEAQRHYHGPAAVVDTSGLASRQVTHVVSAPAGSEVRGHVAERLADSLYRRSFLALGVVADRVDRATELLLLRHDVRIIDVTEVLLKGMRDTAREANLAWALVLASDSATEGSRDAQGLRALVRRSLPRLEATLDGAATEARDRERPLLLTDLAPLARYGHLSILARWTDLSAGRPTAVWALVPQLAGAQGAVIDGRPLPLAAPGQFLRLDAVWLSPEPGAEGVAA